MKHYRQPKLFRDPATQYKFNLSATWFWLVLMIVIPFTPPFRGHESLPAMLIMEVSLWANLATHIGALSGSEAAMNNELSANKPL